MHVLACSIRVSRAIVVVRVTATESAYVSTFGLEVAIGPEPFACIRDFCMNLVAPCRDFNLHRLGPHDHRTWMICQSCDRILLVPEVA